MLDELRRITSTEPYKSSGGMKVKEIAIRPWETPDTTMVLEVWIDEEESTPVQTWELTCTDLSPTQNFPQCIIPRTQLKIFEDHPALWHLDDEVFYTITSKGDNIPSIMGELFIAHAKACGNWVDFHWLYDGLPETMETLRENQMAVPSRLKETCFEILERYGVQYKVNTVQDNEKGYKLLLFSSNDIWPDDENFKQSYIIAKEFAERRVS
ncbi:hypothetical protein [Flavisolibacter ginsenosidimutans]|uniref:Uncharacterized protein n=1 Tax=Flavisolibacter ginsenosidimutans TaxID=661481 RepID=A0A5B8UIG2_9BACT|nr:hypothetical protein [Flavisolibacter ginsenosidimutans]QEC56348.1 hypothetical protein FSB75_10750 [Flavisolibacter ginsenosidimutans]